MWAATGCLFCTPRVPEKRSAILLWAVLDVQWASQGRRRVPPNSVRYWGLQRVTETLGRMSRRAQGGFLGCGGTGEVQWVADAGRTRCTVGVEVKLGSIAGHRVVLGAMTVKE